ncbi:NAD(P)H-hydrate dehydratase [Patescibacteria group bacterium]|nr:NAD(P)H-hydrate dehydratase [Patescibacteria group bacterium]
MDTKALSELLIRREPTSHKKSVGTVLVIGGSAFMPGAPILACHGAYRAGAGLVKLLFPESVYDIKNRLMPEVVLMPGFEEDNQSLSPENIELLSEEMVQEVDTVVIGPGMSRNKETIEFILQAIKVIDKPLIIDADALYALSGNVNVLSERTAPTILTPHEGEMGRLLEIDYQEVSKKREEVTLTMAKEWNSFIVLKGNKTVVCSPDGQKCINETGSPALATAGTGDVLSGILAALLAQFPNQKLHTVLSAGVFIHGFAGDLAERDLGERSVVATDLIRYLPKVFKQAQSV